LTDAERHARFVDMAREVQASDEPKDCDKVFKAVAPARPSPPLPIRDYRRPDFFGLTTPQGSHQRGPAA
jgi:hypothetical protein